MSLIASRQLFRSAELTFDLGYDSLGVALLKHLLHHLPSHMAAHCLLAETYLARESWAEAQEHLDHTLGVDPMNLRALRGRGCVASAQGVTDDQNEYLQLAWKLYPYDTQTRQLLEQSPDDSSPLVLARVLTAFSRHQEALPYYEAALRQEFSQPSDHPIEALIISEAYWRAGRPEESRPVLEIVLDRQPTWVRPRLILGDIALEGREDVQGVALLHDASALDSSLLVARELFAQDERYDWLMEESLRVPSPGSDLLDAAPVLVRYLLRVDPLPEPFAAGERPAVEALPAGTPREATRKGGKTAGPTETGRGAASAEVSEEELIGEFRLPDPGQSAGVRLILSSRSNLVTKYGDDGFEELDAKLADLCGATARSTGHEVMKIYVDDTSSLEESGLGTVDTSDAREIEQLIRRLNGSLANQHKKLKSLLIVGGDSVIPFHRLANPADDDDAELLSDWPYAAEDGAPLVAKFCVGRLPGSNGGELEVLLKLVETAIHHHQEAASGDRGAASTTWLNPIRRLFGSGQTKLTSVGYSADVWAEASRAVFEAIGDAEDLRMSPPLTDYDFLSTYERIPTLGYFNLHGFQGSPYWYGHGESDHGTPLLPVALTPLAVSWASAEGAVVYSEACYGAELQTESGDESIALNFLASGAWGFIGSTAMSYGSLSPPLLGADLLGKYLWEGILGGLAIGDAFRRARSSFIRAAGEDQGYLDGEDQKALLSFVLYGDPSLRLARSPAVPELEVDLEVTCPPLACCSAMADAKSLPLPRELKEKVQRSVPLLSENGMEAHPLILCRVPSSHRECGGKACHADRGSTDDLPELIMTSQDKVVRKGGDQLRHVVKVTVNAQGDVLKVVMSRGGTRVREGSRRQ